MNQNPQFSTVLADNPGLVHARFWLMQSRQQANILSQKFFRTGNLADGDAAISFRSRMVSLMAQDNPDILIELSNLAVLMMQCYERHGDPTYIQRAIETQRAAVSIANSDTVQKPGMLTMLGLFLSGRFRQSNNTSDLEEAIYCHCSAFLYARDDNEDIPVFASNLAGSLAQRYLIKGDITDINEAIECLELAIIRTPDSHPEKPKYINNLGLSLRDRFKRLWKETDIDEAIQFHRRAISFEINASPQKLKFLNDLGNSLRERSEYSNSLIHVNEAIESHQLVLSSLLDTSNREATYAIQSLGDAFALRFRQANDRNDLEKAVQYSRLSVTSAAEHSPERMERLAILSSILRDRFKQFGNPVDVDEAISGLEEVTSSSSEQKAGPLGNLGLSLYDRFGRTGNLADLDQAIKYLTQATTLASDKDLSQSVSLSNLGLAFERRSEHLDSLGDLERAISCHRKAISLASENKPSYFNNLGLALARRFDRLGGVSTLRDIDEAIESYQRAITLTPRGRAQTLAFLDNLGTAYGRRFKYSKELEDIDQSIKHQEEAISLLHDGHPEAPGMLNNLGVSFGRRFGHSGHSDDVNKAIEHQQKAVALTPDGHLQKPRFLTSLSFSISRRLQSLNNAEDAELMLSYIKEAAMSHTGPALIRFVNARQWAQMPHQNTECRLAAYETAMSLVPRLVWLGATVNRRYQDAAQLADLATEAAAFAVSIQQYERALEWLEEGRAIIWGQQLQLRTPLDNIRATNPELAAQLELMGQRVESGGHDGKKDQTESLEEAAQNQRRAAEERDRLVAEARGLPGCEDFLRPKKIESLLPATRSGPVVVINIHISRCDALIMQPAMQTITHIPLPRFSFPTALKMQQDWTENLKGFGVRDRGFRRASLPQHQTMNGGEILAMLWNDVVEPILSGLGYLRIHADDQLPHVTWCTTGPLVFLPIHAAGHYTSVLSRQKTFNYVVSSYTPTISALLVPIRQSHSFRGILAVGQGETAGMSPLPCAVEEIQQIQRITGDLPATVLCGDEATVDKVLKGMKEHSWVHLACHAIQDPETPTESAFFLSDGRLDLAAIMKEPLPHAEFAFLSACQTALGHKDLPEEAIHLAAGMIMAGYTTVIGTMWSVRDRYAPVIAGRVYSRLVKDGKPSTYGVAEALHKAVADLRDEIGESRFEDWAPFVHIGV